MRTRLLSALLLVWLTRTAFALTCGGFSIDPSPDVVIRYSASLAAGATRSTPVVSRSGSDVTVTRNISGGSSVDATCVDDTIDLGPLSAGRYNVTWTDNSGFSTQRAQFSFAEGGASGAYLNSSALIPQVTTLLPPALPSMRVRLEVPACSPTAPVGYVAGTNVNIVQYGIGASACPIYILDLGQLPEARYDVTIHRFPAGWVDDPFSFIVQQPAPSSSACGQGTSVSRTARGTAHLHFEESFPGYLPSFGPPTVAKLITSDSSGWYSVAVEQPVTDIDDRSRPGAAPTQSICHAEDLDLGVIPDGYYDFRWSDIVSVAGTSAAGWGTETNFRFERGSILCTDHSTLWIPSVVIAGEPFQIERRVIDVNANGISLNVMRNGSVITVTEYLDHEGPIPYGPPGCLRQPATIGPLPAGQYTLVWTYSADPRVTNPTTLSTTLTVSSPTRQRGVHH